MSFTVTREPWDDEAGTRLIDNFGPYAGEPLSVCYARPL